MVVASGSPAGTVSNASSKLRRSRRLSSTRGLKVRESANTAGQAIPRQDLNQKLGLCPIVSRNVADTKGRPAINWELNERISLSSGSSAGLEVRPDARKGIELSGNRKKTEADARAGAKDNADKHRESRNGVKAGRLELMNVSGFQQDAEKKRRRSWSIEIDVIERPSEENVLKSDSKYEIGVPSEGARKPKQRRQLSGSSKTSKSAKNEDEESTNGRWGRKKADKTNDSISKRLELIHELNQKILANYERFQQKSKRNHSKSGKEAVKPGAKDPAGRCRAVTEDEKESKKEDPLYAEVKRKGKTKTESVVQRCQDSLGQRKLDINKFTFSKEHCDKLTSSKDQPGTLNKKR